MNDQFIRQLLPGTDGKGPERVKSVIDTVTSPPYAWDLSGKFPVPEFELGCSFCGGDQIQISRMMFTIDKDKGVPWRCDFYYKCTICSFGPSGHHFGIPITEAMWERHDGPCRHEWRDIRSTLMDRIDG